MGEEQLVEGYVVKISGDETEIMETIAKAIRHGELTRYSDFHVFNNFNWDDVPQWMKDQCRWQAEFILRILKDQYGGSS